MAENTVPKTLGQDPGATKDQAGVGGFIEDVQAAADAGLLDGQQPNNDVDNPDNPVGGETDDAEAAEGDEPADEPEERDPVDTSPNVIFIGSQRRNGKSIRSKEAPATLISGPDKFEDLPSSEEQVKGFYYERAAELCRAFPGLYKKLIEKGEQADG